MSWGGANYVGAQAGSTTNDADGNFGPAFGIALPDGFGGIKFSGAASSSSISNSIDYAFTSDPATVTRNNGAAFTVVPEAGSTGLFALGVLSLGGFAYARRRGSHA